MDKFPVGQLVEVEEHEYRAWNAPSYSLLKHVAKTPAHALAHFLHPPEQTPAMRLGMLAHLAILQPTHFSKSVIQKPDGLDRRTREGKAQWAALEAQHPGAEVIDPDDYTTINDMAESAYIHPSASALLQCDRRLIEASFAWREPVDEVDVIVKARPDLIARLPNGRTAVVDIKTTKDASPKGFAREVVNYSYLEQAAFYLRGLRALADVERDWIWIAIEKEPPYAVGVYHAYLSDLAAAEQRIVGWLETWTRCCRSESWPAYSNEAEPLIVPEWAYRS